jgi:hypothetical protein
MTVLQLNCITNWDATDAHEAARFERLINQYSDLIESDFKAFALSGSLTCIYVQYQYACQDVPGSKRGTKSLYSRKHNDLQIYIEVAGTEFDHVSAHDQRRLLASRLVAALDKATKRLNGDVRGNVEELVARLNHTLERFLRLKEA